MSTICGHCRLPIANGETGVRHFGHYVAHTENRCVSLLSAEIDRLREDRDAFRASSDIRGAEVERLTARVAEWEQKAANWMASPEAGAQLDGYRELAQRLNAAEMRVAELERALLLIEPSGDFSGWEDRDGNDIGAVINAALSKDGA